MTTTTRESKSAGPVTGVPPERYWRRYSPHGEAPLSLAGSVALHLLIGGALLLLGVYAASLLGGSGRKMPVEPVRLGGDGVKGVGVKTDSGGGPVEDPSRAEEKLPGQDDTPPRPALTPIEIKAVAETFDPDSARIITQSNHPFGRLDEKLRKMIRPAGPGPIPGDGGAGGKGGPGAGPGPGKEKLDPRTKRMLRWHMHFTARSGPEYVAQLRSLGAILAFPAGDAFRIVRELRAGAKAGIEDVAAIQRIYWIDDKPASVRDVLSALGLPAEPLPGRFIAFMPEELERQLFDMEKRYVTQTLRLRWDEDRLDETNFRVVPNGRGGYRPELVSVSMKR